MASAPAPARRRLAVLLGAAAALAGGALLTGAALGALPGAGSGGLAPLATPAGPTERHGEPGAATDATAREHPAEAADPRADAVSPSEAAGEAPFLAVGDGGGDGLARRADPRWVEGQARATGIPERALAAYAGAAIVVAAERPGCGLGWNTLAAIGEMESDHGRIGGGAIGEDGLARPRIIGPALDGVRFAAIPDSDGGLLDGDTVWDRAVGPMQFIPDTWARWGEPVEPGRAADPHSIDDASLAAARYLCEAGGDLTRPAGWRAAVAAYNNDRDYAERVSAAATRYGSR